MKEAFDNYFLKQEEPNRSTLLAIRQLIVKKDPAITEAWKYGMPFFCIGGKMVCYLWVHKKFKQPYLGIVEGSKIDHPRLLQEKRARMKILLIDPEKDLPIKMLNGILSDVVRLYK